jgi:rRNA maturation RNase YbeY
MRDYITITNAHPSYRMRGREIAKYVGRVLKRKGTEAVSVVFVDSRRIRRLNEKYLGHNEPTDVIGFALETEGRLEGEIYVNLDRAKTQARQYGVTLKNEVARLVIHGALHLVGFGDRTATQAQIMRREEDRHMAFWFSGKKRRTK